MQPWQARVVEEANLFNPAFCVTLLAKAADEFSKKGARPLPFALVFLTLPIVLHHGTRSALPASTVTSLLSWIQDNRDQLVNFAERVQGLRPITREALLFGMARAHGVGEVGHAGVHPHAVGDVHGIGSDAADGVTVEVVDHREAVRRGRVHEGALHGREVVAGELVQRQRPTAVMQALVGRVAVLQTLHRGQEVVEGPAGQVPIAQVLRAGTDRHRAVDRRGAAEHLAAEGGDGTADVARLGHVAPIGAGHVADVVAVCGAARVVPGGVDRPGLDEQHAARHARASRTATLPTAGGVPWPMSTPSSAKSAATPSRSDAFTAAS